MLDPQPNVPRKAGPGGLIRQRSPLMRGLNALRKKTALNPYWIEQAWLNRAARMLAPKASGSLLDVGVGEKPYGELFAPHVTSYTGLEYPPVADNLHPEIWAKLETIVDLVDVFGDGMRLPFASNSFDTVLSFEVLEHVPDPNACVSEMARVVRPGGRVLMTVPFSSPRHQLPFDFFRYTPNGLEALLTRHGLEVESLDARGNFAAATGATLSHFLMRCVCARSVNHDGSVNLSRWRAPFVLPVIAAVQILFEWISRVTSDTALTLGYVVVARAPDAPAPVSRATSSSKGASTISQS